MTCTIKAAVFATLIDQIGDENMPPMSHRHSRQLASDLRRASQAIALQAQSLEQKTLKHCVENKWSAKIASKKQ